MKEFMSIIIKAFKKVFLSSLIIFTCFNLTFQIKSMDPMQLPEDMPMLPNGNVYVPFVGEMKPEELDKMMNEVNTFMENLSPEERTEFMNVAEDLAVEMINENPEALVPPGGYMTPQKPAPKEPVEKPATKISKPKKRVTIEGRRHVRIRDF